MSGTLLWWGAALIVLGAAVGATGAFGIGGPFTWIGWLILVIGVVLVIVHLASYREPQPTRE